METIGRYGTWASPVTAADVARGEALLEWVGFVGDEVWWTEARPEEAGRNALVRRGPDGTIHEVLAGWDIRCRVIEYGSRPWLALSSDPADGIVFTRWDDQRVYRWRPGTDPTPLSPAGEAPWSLRYCDFSVSGSDIWCLRETAADADATRVQRHLVALPLDGRAAEDHNQVRVLAASHHFMTGPRIDPTGRRVAWLGWNHPLMPWEATDLMVADIGEDGTLAPAQRISGGNGKESITQCEWAATGSGALYAVTDPNGWWNVHEISPAGAVRNLHPAEEEFGEALWRIGARWCLPLTSGRLAVIHGTSTRRLGFLSDDGQLSDVDSPYTEWQSAATDGRRVAAVVTGPDQRRAIVMVDSVTAAIEVIRPPLVAHDAWVSRPYLRTYPNAQGDRVYAHIYPPSSPDHRALPHELPPYVVFAHGGPTNRCHMVVNQEITYFTSRGIGVVDVLYGGSTGLGRAYRERLRGNWGIVDVQDCATVARGLIDDRLADPDRIAIRGLSAGGWTATASLVAEPDLYRAAAIYFPVLDLEGWRIRGTHDFESRYLESLVGAWPQHRDRYHDRSPVNHADQIRVPFVLFQGLADTICPPAQAERLLAGLDADAPYEYLTFEGEGHGFRRADTVITALRAELELYATVFGFADQLAAGY